MKLYRLAHIRTGSRRILIASMALSGLALGSGPSGTFRAAVAAAPTADLSITKRHIDPFTAGRQDTYLITVTNNASPPAGAPGITVTDTLPTGITFVSWTGANWTCTPAGQIVACTYPPSIAVGASVGVVLLVNVGAAAAPGVTNTATVHGSWADPNLANNLANDPTRVRLAADLSVGVIDSPDPVSAGNRLTYTVQARNNGPSPATNVVLRDVPAGRILSVTSSQGICAVAAGTVSCALGNMATGALATVTIRSRSPSTSGPVSTSARVSAAEFDPVPANNAVVEQTTVI